MRKQKKEKIVRGITCTRFRKCFVSEKLVSGCKGSESTEAEVEGDHYYGVEKLVSNMDFRK